MPDIISISFKYAVLCVNCEEITRGRSARCEICGSISLLSLPIVLNRVRTVPPSKPSHLYAREGSA
jgi:rRNA maturation endonuclease Nob1